MSKIEVGKTYQTRDGKTVRILATDLKHNYPVVGAIMDGDGTEGVWYFTANGKFWRHFRNHDLDLIIPPERKSRWMNWYHPESGYSYREEADKVSGSFRTHVLEIIIEDGEPVDVKIHKVEQ